MARRKRNNRNDNPFEDSREQDAPRTRRGSSKNKRRRRWPYVLFLILLIGLLPNIIGWTGLHQTAVNYATSDFDGKITIGKATLGWFQTITLSDISAVDAAGNDLLKIEQVTSSKPIYAFLRTNDYGTLNVKSPTIYAQLRPDGSNFEDALAKYIQPAASKNGANLRPNETATAALPKLTINVIEGRALVSSSTDVLSWQVADLNALIKTATAEAPLTVESKCSITPMQMNEEGKIQLLAPGNLSIQTQLDPGATVLRMGAIDVALITENLPVSLAAPILQRFVGPAKSSGQLSGNIRSKINLNQQTMNVEIANLDLQRLAFTAPALIGADQINVEKLSANGSLEVSPQAISSSNFQVRSDFGKINANGRFDVKQLNDLAAGGTLLNEPFSMDGQIDLAGLVRMLPKTLKLHEDLQVDSGVVQFQAGTKNEEGTRRLVLNMDASNLKARRGSQNIVWQKPLRLVGTLAQAGGRLTIEDLSCESDFLVVAGSATPESGTFRAQGDLSKLMQRVGEFVDLAGINLAGELDGTFGWQTADGAAAIAGQQPIQIGGSFVVLNPVIQLPQMPVWQQPKLSVRMSAAGQSITNSQNSEMILRLDQGGVQIDVGTEQAVATLAQPLQNALSDPVKLNCDVTGSLAGWLGHVRNFVDVGNVAAAGNVVLKCQAALDKGQVQLSEIQYTVDQLVFDGYGMKIRDPQVTGNGGAKYDLKTGNLQIADMTLVGNSIAARGQNLKLAFTPNLLVDGVVAFRADVNRVAEWFELSPTEESIFWFGSAEGNLQLTSTANGIGGRLTSTITDLVAAQRTAAQPVSQTIQPVSNRTEWAELFRESKTQLDTELLLANDFNAVQFQNLVMKSSALSLNAAGSVSDLAASLLTNIQGTWNPDWNKVQSLMAAYTGNLLKLSGSGKQPFSVKGPVFATSTGPGSETAWIPSQLVASTSVRWDQGSILNVPIGASQLDVDLQNSIGKVKTPGIPFSGGVVQFAPSVDMRGENPILVMEPTRVIDNVALTSDTARQWLKFVAPLAADATSAQGNFTLDVNGLRMPIFDPLSVEAQGAVRLSNVVIGAGPLADQLLGTIAQIRAVLKPEAGTKDLKTWLQMSEQTIPVTVKNQKVYHENVTFKHKDTTVITSGAVGFDQSLNMLAEIPIADDWISGKPYLAGLKGQKISIPISGSVTKPQLDKRAIQNLSSQLVKQAAGSALNQAIADKVTPKVGELQNQVSEKFGGEINKLQSKLGEKLGGQVPNLGGFLPGGGTQPANGGATGGSGFPNLGGFLPGNNAAGSGTATGSPTPSGATGAAAPAAGTTPDLGKQLEGELIKGIGNLFGGKK